MTDTMTPPVTSRASQLSDKNRTEGVRLLTDLQTVQRAKVHKDPIPIVVKNIFTNEATQVDFVTYVRKTAGYEVPAQKALVTDLLRFCLGETMS